MTRLKIYRKASMLLFGLLTPATVKAAETGLPQLNMTTWPSQLFWLVVLFAAGYIIMAKLVTPRIGAVLEERRAKLDDDLSRARAATDDAARTRAEYEADLEAARASASEIAKSTTAEAAKKVEESEARFAKKLADKAAKAEAKLAAARNEAKSNLNNIAAEAAIAAVLQLIEVKTTVAEANKITTRLAGHFAEQETN